MKKFLIGVTCLLALTIAAIPAGAQTRKRFTTDQNVERRYDRQSNRRYDNRNYDQVYPSDSYPNSGYQDNDSAYRTNAYPYSGYSNQSIWSQHRDKITTAGGVATGAIIGGLIGGRRGALIGAVAGGGGAALYTYKIRDRYRRY